MKKTIYFAFVVASAALTLPTAFAADPQTGSNPSDSSMSQPQVQGNQDPNAAHPSDSMSSTTTESTETHASRSDTSKSARSCTDENGVVMHHGQKGFKKCMEMRRKKEEMGGQTSDSSMNDSSSNPSPSSDSPPSS